MRTLYLDCGMGAAGDMLTAALLELFDEPNQMVRELAKLRIPGVRFLAERAGAARGEHRGRGQGAVRHKRTSYARPHKR